VACRLEILSDNVRRMAVKPVITATSVITSPTPVTASQPHWHHVSDSEGFTSPDSRSLSLCGVRTPDQVIKSVSSSRCGSWSAIRRYAFPSSLSARCPSTTISWFRVTEEVKADKYSTKPTGLVYVYSGGQHLSSRNLFHFFTSSDSSHHFHVGLLLPSTRSRLS
jgi:hypothetical protein